MEPDTTGTQGTQGPNKPNPTQENQQNQNNQIAYELLAQMGLPVQPTPNPTTPNATTPTASTETTAHSGDVVLSHPVTAGETKALAGHVGLSQLPPEVEVALAAVRRGVSVEVNVSSCPGVCGGRRRGLRLSPVEYLALVHLRVVLGYGSFCDVLRDSRFSGLFCSRRGRVGGVVNLLKLFKVLKEVLRVGSREGPYAASYLLKRIYDGLPYYDFADALVKKVSASLANSILNRYLRGGSIGHVGVGDLFETADGLLTIFARELGFTSLSDFAQYMHLIALNLVEPRYANRHGGYRDILGATCRLCHTEFNTTKPVLRVLWDLTWHFKHAHGLRTVGDVEDKLRELRLRESNRPEGDDVGVRLLRHSASQLQLDRLIVHRLEEVRLFERIGGEYRCRVCNADVGSVVEAVEHALNHHYDVVNRLLGGGQRPGVNEVVGELANLINPDNPESVRHVVKPLVQGILDYINARGSASVTMLTRWLNESDDYRPLLDSLIGNLKPERVVTMIAEALERHGLVQFDGEIVKARQ